MARVIAIESTIAATLGDPSLHSTLSPKVSLSGPLGAFADVQALHQLASLLSEREGSPGGVTTFGTMPSHAPTFADSCQPIASATRRRLRGW